MEYIMSLLHNLLNLSKVENSALLKTSLETQIGQTQDEIKSINSNIKIQNDMLSLYNNNLNEAEKIYQDSKNKLEQYNKTINNKITNFKNKVVSIIDNNKEQDTSVKCNEIDNIYTKFKFDKNITISERYSNLNKDIEENVVKCEIIKEKIDPIKLKLKELNADLGKLNETLQKYQEVEKSLQQ